jgi:hypothetical protein
MFSGCHAIAHGAMACTQEAEMDDHEKAFQTVCRCAGEIRQYLDKGLLNTLPIHDQSFLLLTKVKVEDFLKAMKDDGHPLEPILEAMMIHAVALQGKCDELLEQKSGGWLSKFIRMK